MLRSPGAFPSTAYAALGSVDFEYQPRQGHSTIAVFTTPTTAATVRLFRKVGSDLFPCGAAQAVAGAAEDSQAVGYPIPSILVIRVTDTSNGIGSVKVSVSDDGSGTW